MVAEEADKVEVAPGVALYSRGLRVTLIRWTLELTMGRRLRR